MKLEGVTAFKIRPCVSRIEWNNGPCTGRKNCGRVGRTIAGKFILKASLAAEDCKLFTMGVSEIMLDNGVHQSWVRTLATCFQGFENLSSSSILEIFVTKVPTSAFTASVKNWDERQLLCVAYHVFGVRNIYIAY